MRKTLRTHITALAVAAAAAASAGCGSEAARSSRSAVYLVIDGLEAASGAEDDDFGSELFSDIETLVSKTVDGELVKVPTYFADTGRVDLRLAMKDVGPPGNPTGPTTNNSVTVTRYRVTYRRTDGRNTPGVDVPYPFEGAATVTIGGGSAGLGFTLVRLQAKLEAPLMTLRQGGGAGVISAIADVTFYGRDQVGNDVEATGSIGVTFADWADPD